jgi:hypothetical protein
MKTKHIVIGVIVILIILSIIEFTGVYRTMGSGEKTEHKTEKREVAPR